MNKPTSRNLIGISILIGLASNFIPPWNPGMFFGAIAADGLGDSRYSSIYVFLGMGFGSCLVALFSHWILSTIFRNSANSRLPVKGIIYTESEIEEFKRRGLM